eukprot:GEMP01079552.1.p1 GENE.GEMP01079552.1~~GEMP01079552.1.p1  ORF type:complete len:265 (+),score=44.66 GEMP01079552.1:61-795(+)
MEDTGSEDDQLEASVSELDENNFKSNLSWIHKMRSVEVFESDIQAMVFNFFTVMGMKEAAEAFVNEAMPHFEPGVALSSVTIRNQVRKAITEKDIPFAIQLLQELDSDLLQQHPYIDFRLNQKILETKIMSGNIEDAVTFAQQTVAPLVAGNSQLLTQLEDSMALLAYQDLESPEAQQCLSKLGSYDDIATLADDAILTHYGTSHSSKLEVLCQNMSWCQRKLSDGVPAIPISELDKGQFKDDI